MILRRLKELQLIFSICIGMSILYQIYFFEFNNGALVGGELQRLLLKIVFTAVFTLSVSDYLSWDAFFRNLPYKAPILYVVISICVVAPWLEPAYLQALNIVFFLPILFIDWNKDDENKLFEKIWTVIAVITLVQLFLDPIFKFSLNVFWDNKALIGGMGNPNVFGIFLIVSGLACQFLINKFRKFSTLFFFSTVLTGSVISLIVGLLFIITTITSHLKHFIIICIVILTLLFPFYFFTISLENYINEIIPIKHVLDKLFSSIDFLSNDFDSAPSSLLIRIEYLNKGLMMMKESPLSFFFGHPDLIPMYNGDGLWISYLVSYGVPLFLYFLMVNLLLFYRGIKSSTIEFKFAGAVIFVCMCFFITNRILDYWPTALLYFLAFSYLTNKYDLHIKIIKN